MEALLSVSQAAELEGVSSRAIQKKVKKLRAVKVEANTSALGYEYRIPLKELSAKAKARYYAEHQIAAAREIAAPASKPAPAERLQDKSLEDLTAAQREQATHWRRVLDEWRAYIAQHPKRKTEMTAAFLEEYNRWHPERPLSERTLRHKWKLYRDYGEIALADGRADRRASDTTIPDVAWSIFLQWWLSEGQPGVLHIYNLLRSWLRLEMPDITLPAVDSFYRATKRIPQPVLKFFREGNKVFEDEALVYLQRMYDWIDSNDVWVADYHTLDLMVRCDYTGRIYRPHAVAWLDVRSRKILSVTVCESSNSDGVISSFRKAVKKYGVPKAVYLDNGREFLVSDFGGRGKRRSSGKGYGETMLERMQVEMVNARVANAKAKIIERAFRTFTEQFAKLVNTYTGGSPDRRPERLDAELKRDDVPLLSSVIQKLELYIEGWYNTQASRAAGVNGLTRNEAYERHLVKKRVATEEQLNLMMLRTARLQSVDRDGVYLKFGEQKLWFYSIDLVEHYMKQKVFVRYDPEELSSVRVYDEQDRYLMTAEWLRPGGYGGEADKEAIKRANHLQKQLRKRTSGYMDEHLAVDAPSAMDAMMRVAEENVKVESARSYDAPVLELIRTPERQQLQRAAGAETDPVVDMSKMIANAKRTEAEE